MTVTLELKPEIERRLAEEARRKNLKIETYLEVFIEKSFENNGAAEEQEKPPEEETAEEWIAKFNKWADSHKGKNYPSIPDEALRRENMYED